MGIAKAYTRAYGRWACVKAAEEGTGGRECAFSFVVRGRGRGKRVQSASCVGEPKKTKAGVGVGACYILCNYIARKRRYDAYRISVIFFRIHA